MGIKEDDLHHFLNRVADGEAEVLHHALELFRDSIIYLPIFPPPAGAQQVKIKPATFDYHGQRYVPIFTSELFLDGWADSKYVALPIYGGDLASVLPKGMTVLVNPGSRGTVELSLADLDVVFNHDSQPANNTKTEAPTTGRVQQDNRSVMEILSGVPAAADPEQSFSDPVEAANIILPTILEQYHEVMEGFYLPPSRIHRGGVVALLTTEFDPSRRFQLVGQIKEFSKRYFGSFGAVEFLDEVNAKRAPWWNNLRGIEPIYRGV